MYDGWLMSVAMRREFLFHACDFLTNQLKINMLAQQAFLPFPPNSSYLGLAAGQWLYKAGGITGVNARLGDVFSNHAAGTNYGVVANGYRQYSCIAANGNVITNLGWFPKGLVAAGGAGFGKRVVDEHYPVAYKAVVANGYQLTDKGMGLYFAVVTDDYAFLYFGKRADKAVIAQRATINVTGLHNGNTGTDDNIIGYANCKLLVAVHYLLFKS